MKSKDFTNYEDTRIGSVYLSCLLDTLEDMNRIDIIDGLALKDPSLISADVNNVTAVSLVQLMDIYLSTYNLTGTIEFSIRIGHKLKVSNHGGISNLLISAPNLKSAIESLVPFYQLRAPFLSISLNEHGSLAEVIVDVTFMHHTPLEAIVAGLLTGVSLNVLDFYGISASDEFRIFLNQIDDGSIKLYREHFGITPFHGKKTFSITFPRQYLQTVSPLADKELFELALKNCEALALEKKPARKLSFSERVMEMIVDNPERPWSQEMLAMHMHTSVSTLRRRFKREGVTYKDVVTSAKMQAAITLLLQTDRQITEISQELGFSDASNFSSAFKRHTGLSPREFRLQRLGRR